jgi:hypothetical protein
MQPFQLRFDLGHADGRFVTLVAHRLSSISAGTVQTESHDASPMNM